MLYEPKFIQISTNSCPDGNGCLYALDSDGNVWELTWTRDDYQWSFIGSPAGTEKQ
jgi:hypothetical protein